MEAIKTAAMNAIRAGISVLPVDGKKPLNGFRWRDFQSKVMDTQEVERYFNGSSGLGIICGKVSRGLEVMDFDLKHDSSGKLWDEFTSAVRTESQVLWDVLSESIVSTKNNGRHIYYRCDEVAGNMVLAKEADNTTLIETRGEGGYVVAPPSQGYTTESQDLQIHEITAEERSLLHSIARKFNRHTDQKSVPEKSHSAEVTPAVQSVTPWDSFNAQNNSVDLLESYGWEVVKRDNQRTYLKRPGESEAEHSGNVKHDSGLFICHSTSTEFPAGKALTPHAVLTYHEFGGDFQRSASYLSGHGFGSKTTTAIPAKEPDKEPADLLSELEACRVHSGMIVVKPIPIIAVKGNTISTAGNITGIIGASKAGKSAMIQAGLAGSFNREGKQVDTLGMDVIPSDGKLILHMDTEQSIHDHHYGILSALKRGGWDSEPDYFKSYNITGHSVEWCRNALRTAGEHYAGIYGGIHSIWLDGPADFLTSVNDEKESNAFVLDLLMFARHHSCPIICTLHFNPGDMTKGRGHLGSAFERKCQSVLSVTKTEDGMSKYEPLKGLLRSSGAIQPFTFQYSVADGFHVSRGFTINKKEAERQELFDDMWHIFEGGKVSHSYTDLVSHVMDVYDIKNNSAKKKVAALVKRGILVKYFDSKSLFDGKKPRYKLQGGQVD